MNKREKHFEILVSKKKIARAEYAPITDKDLERWGAEFCEYYREICLKNFDFNMENFKKIDRKKFDLALSNFLERHKDFKQINNLKEFSKVPGYYILVLDEYKQIYIGKSGQIKERILQHWSRKFPLDRCLWTPDVAVGAESIIKKSKLSIDSFFSEDTTRIFVWPRELVDGIERDLINDFPEEFLLNRIEGDFEKEIEALNAGVKAFKEEVDNIEKGYKVFLEQIKGV